MRSKAYLPFSVLILCILTGLADATASTPEEFSHDQVERVLAEGKIIRKEQIGTGVTKPLRLWIELDGVTISASYKNVEYEKRGVTRFASGNAEVNFTDRYEYERAAYLLDRALGLDMVPVTVIRKVYRKPGAVALWIGNSVSEYERLEQSLRPPDVSDFIYQQADMRIFDALIYNTDRHAQNQLLTLTDWRLHLIDHSRAFRVDNELPEAYLARPVSISRKLLAALENLTEEDLKRMLKRELGPRQIRSLLTRRDLILKKHEEDRRDNGDAFAFREEELHPRAAD